MNNFRPVKTSCWEKYLIFMGYKLSTITGSHYQYTKKNARTVPVWGDEKDIPAFHAKSALKNMGKELVDFYDWAEKNC